MRWLPLLLLALAACDRTPPPAPARRSAPPTQPAAPGASAAPAVSAPAAPPAPRGVDRAALAALIAEARSTASDALIVVQHGRVIGEWQRDPRSGPIQTMSITKSVLALLVGCLVDAGKLGVDQPVHAHFPEWSAGERRRVRVRHLLEHSSGLEEGRSTREIYASRSFVQHALSAPIVHPPGTHYEYGNRASNLLAGLLARAAGQPTDQLARRCLLEPLGIRRWSWSRDRTGQAHGLAGLHLLPRDLARIGELVLARGEWDGRRVLSAAFVDCVTREPAAVQPEHRRLAELWWLLPRWTRRSVDRSVVLAWEAGGVDPTLIARARTLEGRVFDSSLDHIRALRQATGDPKLDAWDRQVWQKKLPDARHAFGPIVGSYAQGSLGQYLVVVPEHRLVAVRMRRAPSDPAERKDIEKTFPDFPARVLALVERDRADADGP